MIFAFSYCISEKNEKIVFSIKIIVSHNILSFLLLMFMRNFGLRGDGNVVILYNKINYRRIAGERFL